MRCLLKAVILTLVCHAATEAQRLGRFPAFDDRLCTLPEPALIDADHLLCAPEPRAQATAAGLGGHWRIEPALRDLDMGEWAGQSLKALAASEPCALEGWLEDPHQRPPAGERLADLQARTMTWLDTLHAPGQWAAITHPWVIRAATAVALALPPCALYRIDVLPLARVTLQRTDRWRLRLG